MGNRSTNQDKGLNKWIDGHQLDYTNTSFGVGGGTNPPPPATFLTATGGNIADAQPMTGSPTPNNPTGNWKYHVWRYPCPAPQSSFVVTDGSAVVEYLVVGGGGGGQGSSGGGGGRGGGGAGGVRTNVPGVVTDPQAPGGSIPLTAPAITCNPGTFAVVAGAGGASTNSHNTPASRGGLSSIAFATGTITANGGGGGFYPEGSPNEGPGACGGGNMNPGPTIIGFGNRDASNNPTPHQGYPSGNGGGNGAAGGGGAGTAGFPCPAPGDGGDGGMGVIVNIAPPSYGAPGVSPGRWYAGGGGGASSWNQSGTGGLGGSGAGGNPYGGGGNGAQPPTGGPGGAPGSDGAAGTGGGGGGACGPETRWGGNGGSGIVIVRYET